MNDELKRLSTCGTVRPIFTLAGGPHKSYGGDHSSSYLISAIS